MGTWRVWTLRDRLGEWLRFVGAGLIVLAVAGAPWFWDRRRPREGLPVAS